MSKNELLFKVVIIGDASTGKSSLLRRYCENAFEEQYKCTVGVDFQIKILKMKDQRIVKLQIWDTAGQERFKVMTKSYYRSARACLIIYDITRRETFDNVRTWAEQYMQSNPGGKHSVMILGNKKDLQDQRTVKVQEGEQLAEDIGCTFQEVSAKEGGEEINELFYNMAETLLSQNDMKDDGKKDTKKTTEKSGITLDRNSIQPRKKDGCC